MFETHERLTLVSDLVQLEAILLEVEGTLQPTIELLLGDLIWCDQASREVKMAAAARILTSLGNPPKETV